MFRLIIFINLLCFATAQEELFALNILHYNDFHARFVETSPAGNVCNPDEAPCVGGFARLATMVREGFEREPHSLLLNGGDSFQGTIWFNLLGWNVTQEFMNMLPHDAHVLGNHEFDNGIEFAVHYLEHLKNHTTVVTANIIDDEEPTMQGLYEPSVIVERNGRKIGIIGVLIASTHELASTGNLVFTDEVEAVRREAEILNAQGVDIIIVLSHCGIEIDRQIAQNGGPYIDIIVGGHSHTLLYNGEPSDTTAFIPLGPYPVVVEQNGKSVLIVQAAAHLLYLGEIKLFFDSVGNLIRWEGNPHYSDNEIEQGFFFMVSLIHRVNAALDDETTTPDVLEKINYYLPYVEELATQEIGTSLVQLSSSCACSECNLGNLICDAFMHAAMMEDKKDDNWHYAHFCVINQGGIRSGISSGVITYESVILSTPFENNVEVFDLRGDHIMEMLEFSVANDPYSGARMLQMSGLRPVFDGSRPLNDRVVSVSVRCIECDVPRYEPLQTDKYYRVVSQSFIGEGGDGFSMISNNRINLKVIGVDFNILMDYISHQTPVFAEEEGRIHIDNACMD